MLNDLKYNPGTVHSALDNFHLQIEHAIEIGSSFQGIQFDNPPNEIIVTGMGGSAIGADYFKTFMQHGGHIPNIRIDVNRYYKMPDYINENTFVIVSSYSGNTEESVSALLDAYQKTKKIACITTGGKVEKLSRERNIPVFNLPEGFHPRCALGYSFIYLAYIAINSELMSISSAKTVTEQLNQLRDFSKKIQKKYSVHDFNNPAFKLANELFDRIPVIYSSELMQAVNLRWRGQFQENSKSMAFGNLVPEMNHNEINGWFKPESAVEKLKIILLRDRENHPRVKIRFEAMKELFREMNIEVVEFYGIGDSFMDRMFDLTLLGDWTSYYLAVLYKQDPNAIPIINKFKEIMNKAKE